MYNSGKRHGESGRFFRSHTLTCFILPFRFPAETIVQLLTDCATSFPSTAEQTAFEVLTTPLREATIPYAKSHASGVPGSERAMLSFLDVLRNWIAVERWFCDGESYADAVDNLRKAYPSDNENVLTICRAHASAKTTASIVATIVSMVSDGSRIDSKTSAASPIGRRVSILTGADSLSAALPCLSEIGAMKGIDAFSNVSLKARKLLLQASMPSIEDRKQKFWDAALKLVRNSNASSSTDIASLLDEHLPMQDIFFPLLKTASSASEEISWMELVTRNLYRPYTVKEFERDPDSRSLKFSFLNKPSESVLSSCTSVLSTSDLSRIVSSSTSLSSLADLAESDSENNLLQTENKENIPHMTLRTGVCFLIDSIADMDDSARVESVLNQFPQEKCASGPINVLYVVITSSRLEATMMDEMAYTCQKILTPYHARLAKADVRRVTFTLDQVLEDGINELPPPALFTYRSPDFQEESLYRHIEPSHVFHLDLNRIATNFRVKNVGSRHTITCFAHMYEATPKTAALIKDKKANKCPRIFVRALSYVLEFSSSSFEGVLVDALNAMDVVTLKSKVDNHLFINMISDYDKLILDPVVVEQVVVDILKRHGERITNLGIAEVEARIVCCLSRDSPPIALRLVASNPTGFVHVMSTYVEAISATGGERVFKLIGGTKASLASSSDSSWEGQPVDTPYPLTRPFDAQRMNALNSSDTLYCYDLPALFEAAIEQQWTESATNGGIEGGIRAAGRPLMVMYTSELVVQRKASTGASWTMQDYLDGRLELVQTNRGAGANDVGMVAWLMVLKTREYPEGRQVVMIANDITHKAGSFGTREDVVFKLASEYARERKIPRLYVAANSGARIGLAETVKESFRVAFKDESKPENGFDFLYLTKEVYDRLTYTKQEVVAEKIIHNGVEVYKLTDIIGSEPDLGVENLKGSGLIAGETSAAYQEIFTLTIVLGRTVGIGAYLVRLGQRTIQKSTASPIILTGYQALNKLMGVDVYSTNDQLGGPQIMYPNGISHMVEPDHLGAVKAAIDWLSYIPSVRRGLLPITDIRGIDTIERSIDFTPTAGVPYDPRRLIAGGDDDRGEWQSGFFDKGSFTESLSGWAKTVVVGRARLGGIPMGVVITENRTAEAIKPADPADVKASEAVIQQAGCVWFPNSAYKTAQAINDFRTEDLPLIIFANWRGFSGGQRDMFDEVLKYGALIVDAFVAYQQPVFVFIPPFAEIRGGAWVVLDASINAGVMGMYASKGTARGGVLEANGAASVKYRRNDLIITMHRLDDKLIALDSKLSQQKDGTGRDAIIELIAARERSLLPVYEQLSVQFCELHDTPGRMKAVGVIEREVEWSQSRSFFYWRLRRKLAEFDLRRKIIDAADVGRRVKALTPIEASALIKQWFLEHPLSTGEKWDDDRTVLSWMAQNNETLEQNVVQYTKSCVVQEVFQVMTAGGNTARVGTQGIVEGITQAFASMSPEAREEFKTSILAALQYK